MTFREYLQEKIIDHDLLSIVKNTVRDMHAFAPYKTEWAKDTEFKVYGFDNEVIGFIEVGIKSIEVQNFKGQKTTLKQRDKHDSVDFSKKLIKLFN